MAKRTPHVHNKPSVSQHLRSQSTQPPLLVDPRWLLKALGLVFALAVILTYVTLCFLYAQGQWQLVLHPSRSLAATPASLGLSFTEVHFADDASGQPQLDGWWIPADPANPTGATALMLHSGDGSMSNALPRALTLHNEHLNVLVFDYRGYGRSNGRHPVESTMRADSASALAFLTFTQHIAPSNIVVYGSGIAASLAVQLAAAHPDIPALILDAPDGDFAERARTDPRSRLIATRWFFNQTFPLADPLNTLPTPKLLISYTSASKPPLALQRAADPKMTIEVASPSDPALQTGIQRFLDLYLTQTTH
jgi:hypothetical protein